MLHQFTWRAPMRSPMVGSRLGAAGTSPNDSIVMPNPGKKKARTSAASEARRKRSRGGDAAGAAHPVEPEVMTGIAGARARSKPSASSPSPLSPPPPSTSPPPSSPMPSPPSPSPPPPQEERVPPPRPRRRRSPTTRRCPTRPVRERAAPRRAATPAHVRARTCMFSSHR